MAKVDEKTELRLQELLDEKLGTVARKADIPSISPDTPVPIRITPKQMWGLAVFVAFVLCGVATTVWWLSEREHAFREEFMTLRLEFKDAMVDLRKDMNLVLKEVADGSQADIEQLRIDVMQLKARVPGQHPPEDWLRDVYRRDLEILDARVKALEHQ